MRQTTLKTKGPKRGKSLESELIKLREENQKLKKQLLLDRVITKKLTIQRRIIKEELTRQRIVTDRVTRQLKEAQRNNKRPYHMDL